jgi:hypothetical protein
MAAKPVNTNHVINNIPALTNIITGLDTNRWLGAENPKFWFLAPRFYRAGAQAVWQKISKE